MHSAFALEEWGPGQKIRSFREALDAVEGVFRFCLGKIYALLVKKVLGRTRALFKYSCFLFDVPATKAGDLEGEVGVRSHHWTRNFHISEVFTQRPGPPADHALNIFVSPHRSGGKRELLGDSRLLGQRMLAFALWMRTSSCGKSSIACLKVEKTSDFRRFITSSFSRYTPGI